MHLLDFDILDVGIKLRKYKKNCDISRERERQRESPCDAIAMGQIEMHIRNIHA